MALNMVWKMLIAIGSLVVLAILVVVVERVVNYSADLGQNCPPEIKKCSERTHLYHLASQKCVETGKPGRHICGNNMVISPLMNCSIQGECECDYENNERHLVYDNETDQCYPIYSQGPCEDGKVLALSSDGKRFKCRRDICADEKSKVSSPERDSIVPYKNKCYALSTELDEPGCKGQLKFYKTAVYPSCSEPPIHRTGSFSRIVVGECQPGGRQVSNGLCNFSEDFKFEYPSDLNGGSEEDMD